MIEFADKPEEEVSLFEQYFSEKSQLFDTWEFLCDDIDGETSSYIFLVFYL